MRLYQGDSPQDSDYFRVCVCSGHIPHHKCCSVYVISRVQIAFHTTQLHTKLNVFTSHIPSHRTKRFYTTPPFTSHHSTSTIPPFHITPFHISHTTIAQHSTSHYYRQVPRHISQTFIVATDLASDHHILHLTLHRSLPPTIIMTHHHISKHMFHISHHSTPATIPHHTHIQHHSTPHHLPHHITPPHLDFT